MIKFSDQMVIADLNEFPINTREIFQFIKFLRGDGIPVTKVVFWTHNLKEDTTYQVELELGELEEEPEIAPGDLQ